MGRYILLNEDNIVVGIRYGSEIVVNEIESDTGNIGQIRQPDGSFIDGPEPELPPPSQIEQRIADLEMAIAAILGGVI